MNAGNLSDRLQLLASVGVLIGLGLVGYELRQEANLTRAELGSDTFTSIEELMRSSQNEGTVKALAKAIESPAQLTLEDHLILDGFYWEVYVSHFSREQYMQRRGIFDNHLTGDDLENAAFLPASIIAATDYGRVWWEVNSEEMAPFQREEIDKVLESREIRPVPDRVREIEERLRQVQ